MKLAILLVVSVSICSLTFCFESYPQQDGTQISIFCTPTRHTISEPAYHCGITDTNEMTAINYCDITIEKPSGGISDEIITVCCKKTWGMIPVPENLLELQTCSMEQYSTSQQTSVSFRSEQSNLDWIDRKSFSTYISNARDDIKDSTVELLSQIETLLVVYIIVYVITNIFSIVISLCHCSRFLSPHSNFTPIPMTEQQQQK